ncbi:hypothetical protein ACXM0N_09465 [Peribacillus simplex]
MDVTPNILKEFATLPKYWLGKTPQALEARRLGRQSAERDRISVINWIKSFFEGL